MNNVNKNYLYQTWMTVVYSKELTILDIVNPQHCMLLQLNEDVLLGSSVDELEKITNDSNKQSAAIIAKSIRKAYAENRNVYFEYATTHHDNTVTYAVCYAEKGADGLLYVNVIKIDEDNVFEAREGFTNYVIDVTMNNISVGVIMRHVEEDNSKKYILFNDVAREFFECDDVLKSKYWNQEEDDLADEKAMELRDPLKMEKVIREEKGGIHRWLIFTKKKIKSRAKGFYIITTIIDITQRRQNEILLEQQFALLDSMYKNLPVGITIYDRQGNLLSLNQKYMEIMDIKDRQSVLGSNLFEESHHPEWVKDKLREKIDVEFEQEYEFESATIGTVSERCKKILSVKAVTIRDKNNEADGYLQIYEDITEKKNVVRQLEQKHKLIETIYNAIPIGVEVYNKEGYLVELNDYDMQMMGVVDKKSVSGTSFFNDPNIPHDVMQRLRNGENVEYVQDYDFDLAKKQYHNTNISGRKRMDIKAAFMYDEKNEILGYLFTYKDQTNKVKRERLLEETATKLTTFFNAIASGIEIYDQYGRLIDCNSYELQLFGIEHKEDFINAPITLFNNPNFEIDDKESLLQGSSIHMNVVYSFDVIKEHNYYPTTKTRSIYLELKISPIISSSKELMGFVVVMDDVSYIRQREYELGDTQKNLALALRAGKVAAWTYDVEQKLFCDLQGDSLVDKAIGVEEILRKIHPDDILKTQEVLKSIVKGRTTYAEVIFRYKADEVKGGYRFLESKMVGKKENGKVTLITGTQKDITDLYIRQMELEEYSLKTNLINKACNIVQWDYDPKKHLLHMYVSETILPNVDLDLATYLNYIHPEDAEKVTLLFEQADQLAIDVINAEVRLRISGGNDYKRVVLDGVAIKDKKGNIIKYTGIRRDISKWVELNEQLTEKNIINNLILNNINSGLVYMTPEYVTCWSNLDKFDRMIRTMGNLSSQIDSGYNCFVKEGCHSHLKSLVDMAMQTLEIQTRQYTYNEDLVVEATSIPVVGMDGKIIGLLLKLDDITDRQKLYHDLNKAKEDALLSNQILNEILYRIPNAMYIKDVSNGFRYIKANKIFSGVTCKEEVTDCTDFDIFAKDQAILYRSYDLRLVAGEETVSYESDLIINGQEVHWQINKSIIKIANGQTLIVGISTDITKLHNFNIELAEARKKAEQSDKLKSAFLANMSHEIRTPLNAIVGFSDLLMETEDLQEKNEYNRIIKTNNELLLRLVSDILDLSKIEAGMIDFKRERMDFSVFFTELVSSLKQRLTNPVIEFMIDNPYKTCYVTYDRDRIAQVLTNFVTNAIKYTQSGKIIVGYTCENGGIKIYVTDTGIGISDDKKTRVFQRFEKLDEFAQGTGLGLSICKAITEIDGGKIGFESQEGKGSTFWAWKACAYVEIL